MKTEIRFYFEHPAFDLCSVQKLAKNLFTELVDLGAVIEESAVESREDIDLLNENVADGPSPSI